MTLPAFAAERRAAAPLLLGARRYQYDTIRDAILTCNQKLT